MQPLQHAAAIARRIAQGNLSDEITVTANDDGRLLQAMQAMTDGLRRIVGEARATSRTVNTAATEIAQGSGDLAQRTEEQATALEQTASSMEEVNGAVQQSAANAGQANQLVSTARQQAEQGGEGRPGHRPENRSCDNDCAVFHSGSTTPAGAFRPSRSVIATQKDHYRACRIAAVSGRRRQQRSNMGRVLAVISWEEF